MGLGQAIARSHDRNVLSLRPLLGFLVRGSGSSKLIGPDLTDMAKESDLNA
jgi:hypothetical protein